MIKPGPIKKSVHLGSKLGDLSVGVHGKFILSIQSICIRLLGREIRMQIPL